MAHRVTSVFYKTSDGIVQRRHKPVLHTSLTLLGDLRATTPDPSPHWLVHVREDGSVWVRCCCGAWGAHCQKTSAFPTTRGFLTFRLSCNAMNWLLPRTMKRSSFPWFGPEDTRSAHS